MHSKEVDIKYLSYRSISLALGFIAVVILLMKIWALDNEMQSLKNRNDQVLAEYQDSLKRVQAELATARESMPGLGEYMTTIQLHTGKLWFATRAGNWELAEYELDELKETMESAEGLNAEKNGVKISGVLDSVLRTQIAQLAESIKRKNLAEFQKSYDETVSACNGCHTEAGYKFIHIVRPTAQPVTNQSWDIEPKS